MDSSQTDSSPLEADECSGGGSAPSSVPSSGSKPDCKFAVVDTGGFIRLQRLERVCEKCFIPPMVAVEIRDSHARKHLQSLTATPETRVPTESDLKWARHFARLTGDLGFLSECDIEVIALTYMLHRQHGDVSKLRTSPGTVAISNGRVPSIWAPTKATSILSSETLPDYPVKSKSTSQEVGLDSHFSTAGNVSGSGLGGGKSGATTISSDGRVSSERRRIVDRGSTSIVPLLDEGSDLADSGDGVETADYGFSDDNFESSDGEGEWVTPDNWHLFGVATEAGRIDVACMTTDFSIQNVLIQMGLNVITIDGFRVKSVKLWNLLCRACGTATKDSTRRFCPSCGQQTVDRVPVTVSADTGEVQIHDNRSRRNLRGTIFSIPKTKGGRDNTDLILAEDQLFMGGRMRKHRHEKRLWEKECAEKDPFNIDAAYEQQGWWNRRHLPSGKIAVKGAPRLDVGCHGNPNSVRWHKKGGFKR